MKEEYLHYVFRTKQLGCLFKTTKGLELEVVNFGFHNNSDGPDFLECKISLEGKVWAGQIEFHVKSSDWNRHKHQNDPNYKNVVAHFVYEHDVEIKSGQYLLPTIELNKLIDEKHYAGYEAYVNSKNWIACENEIQKVDSFVIYQQKEKAIFQRLKRKSQLIIDLITRHKGDRQKAFFIMLFKAFGTKVNQKAFESLGEIFEIKIINKLNRDAIKIQAYLFGLAGMLQGDLEDSFFQSLKKEYQYLKQLYQLNEMSGKEWKFSALRPSNFATIRIAQLSQLLLNGIEVSLNIEDVMLKSRFNIEIHDYWKQHYMFSRKGKRINSNLTNSFVDLILINVYSPFIFSIGILENDDKRKEQALELLEKLKPEKNRIISNWQKKSIAINSAFDTQALIEQKNEFCLKSKCLSCMIGQRLLK